MSQPTSITNAQLEANRRAKQKKDIAESVERLLIGYQRVYARTIRIACPLDEVERVLTYEIVTRMAHDAKELMFEGGDTVERIARRAFEACGKSKGGENDEEEYCCGMCLRSVCESNLTADSRLAECHHSISRHCVFPWLVSSVVSTCPLCRLCRDLSQASNLMI